MNLINHNMSLLLLVVQLVLVFVRIGAYAYSTSTTVISSSVSSIQTSSPSSLQLQRSDPPTISRAAAVTSSTPPTATATQTAELSPVLQQIVDERRLYEMNLGKAMDTLRADYSTLLIQSPDFSIYSEDIGVIDPSGVQLQGLSNYKTAFAFLQTIVRFFYNTSSMASYVQHRMVYDFARQSIRISWNAVLTPKLVGDAARVYIDGISVYKLDIKTGKVIEHRIEQMVINGASVVPPYGVLSTLKDVLVSAGTGMGRSRGTPVGVGAWGYYNSISSDANVLL